MRRLRAALAMVAWVLLAVPGQAADADLAALKFQRADGSEASLADYRGRYVLLNVWATWCAPCVEEMPALDRLQAAIDPGRLTVLPLSIDRNGADAVRPFFAEHGIARLPVLAAKGPAVFKAIADNRVPITLLLDRDGREIDRHLGRKAWDSPDEIERLRRLVAGS